MPEPSFSDRLRGYAQRVVDLKDRGIERAEAYGTSLRTPERDARAKQLEEAIAKAKAYKLNAGNSAVNEGIDRLTTRVNGAMTSAEYSAPMQYAQDYLESKRDPTVEFPLDVPVSTKRFADPKDAQIQSLHEQRDIGQGLQEQEEMEAMRRKLALTLGN